MVKYTGYGNCSGLLAQLGLLKLNETYRKGDYSSDSEDSDTEEYSELKNKYDVYVLTCEQLFLYSVN